MIPERHIKQAKQIDNGEKCTGYYVVNIANETIIYTLDKHIYNVDPASVEDVAVKPITKRNAEGYYHEWYPNCGKENMNVNAYYKYCPECGQRIDRK